MKLDFTLDEIRDGYEFDVSCKGSVPQAIVAFLESRSFHDAIRNAVSIGGDSDTIAAITGAIAEAHYAIIDDRIRTAALEYLDDCQKSKLLEIEKKLFQGHVTGAWDAYDCHGDWAASCDPEYLIEAGLIPTVEKLMAE